MNREIKAEVRKKYDYCCATNTLPFFTKHYQCVLDFVVIHPDDIGEIIVFTL